MTGSPRLSVVIPAFDAGSTIGAAMTSVLEQAPADRVEVVVVDDGSTDVTADVVRSLPDDRVRLLSQTRQGRGAARNAGAGAARGDHLMFLDADDRLSGGSVAAVLDAVGPTPGWSGEPGVVRLAVRYLPGSGAGVGRVVEPSTDLIDPPAIPGSFVVARRLFAEIGGYHEHLGFSENSELLYRLADVVHGHGLPVLARASPGVDHRHRADTAHHYRAERIEATRYMLDAHADRLEGRARLHCDLLGVLAHDLMIQGSTREAAGLAWRCVRRRPRPRSAARLGRIVAADAARRMRSPRS
ncbi:MAG: glycosyltransferase [Acidimicrobiales bacterium]